MGVTGVRSLARLARLTLDIEGRWRALSQLQAAVAAAERAGLMVTGERDLLTDLQGLLAQASAALDGLVHDAGAAADGHLAAIEAVVDDVNWDVAAGAAADLQTKVTRKNEEAAAQQVLADDYQKQIVEWQKIIEVLTTAVTNANEFNAPVGIEKRLLGKLDALVKSAERALAGRDYPFVRDSLARLGKLKDEAGDLAEVARKVDGKLVEARVFARQTDLHLIRAELAEKRYQYTLLLRTPHEPGSSGIDIQDESTMVIEDHKFFEDTMDEITKQINAGQARSAAGLAAAAGAFAPPAEVAADGATAAASAGSGSVPPPPHPPAEQTDLVAAVGPAAPAVAAPAVAEPAVAAPAVAAPAPPTAAAGPSAAGLPTEAQPGGNGAAGLSAPQAGGAGPAETGASAPAPDELRDLRKISGPASPPTRTAAELVQDIGDLMYRIVVPETMQRFLVDTKSSLTIRTNDVELPWELMRIQMPAGEPEFLCLERPVARMPTGRAYPRRETKKDRANKPLRFLLIYSDPDPARPLTAAADEVQKIKDELNDEVDAIDVLQPHEVTGRRFNRVLLDAEYDVIHYAGHAAFDKDKPDLSGLLLCSRELFFAQKARRLLEGRPLVFLNACESGRTANEAATAELKRPLPRPAEGLISSFIYGGASACIGSVWPVYDLSAAHFAITFYRHVIQGYMFGEALRQARIKSKEKYKAQITWASFVLYGDPTARLVRW